MPQKPVICLLPLPFDFRRPDFLAFHSRDGQRLAEKTTSRSITKGISWDGAPACLRLVFRKDSVAASLAMDKRAAKNSGICLERTVRRMLGLDQPIQTFEAAYAAHPLLGDLITANPGLRVAQTATPFEALCWAIMGQLVSVHAAIAVRRRVILACGIRHSSGIWCFPDPATIAAMEIPSLRACGLSQTKALSLQTLGNAVASGDIPLDGWIEAARLGDLDVTLVQTRLSAIRGIGPWTISYALLRGFGFLDGSLHGDVAVRRNLARFLRRETITEKDTAEWLAAFTPWRALVASHLWAIQMRDGY